MGDLPCALLIGEPGHDLKLHRQGSRRAHLSFFVTGPTNPHRFGGARRGGMSASLSRLRPQGDLDSFVAREHTDPQIDKG